MTNTSPVVDFLVRLRRIDKAKMKPRDVLILYTVISNPGISGIDIATKLGIPERSHIQSALYRLENLGYIEDRRSEENRRKAISARFHPLPAGIATWENICP